MARIAYAVDINFDGDIACTANGFHILTGEDALSKTRKLVKTALEDMLRKYKEKGWNTEFWLGETLTPLEDIVSDDKLLDEFIEEGGGCFGNWDITVQEAEEE